MVDTTRFSEWLDMAKKDLKGAEILYKYDADYGLVCFHCQQAIEKYLKGYLIYKTGLLQEGHSLVKLCKKVIIFQNDFKKFLKDCAFVNAFYIETRYPADDPLIVSKEEVLMCFEITKNIMNGIESLLH